MLLLPYSVVGPFAGVFLDRWRRQRVLVHTNTLRAVLTPGAGGAKVTRTAPFATPWRIFIID